MKPASPSALMAGRRHRLLTKSSAGVGGALANPSTSFIYDWNMLPIGQRFWLDSRRRRVT